MPIPVNNDDPFVLFLAVIKDLSGRISGTVIYADDLNILEGLGEY